VATRIIMPKLGMAMIEGVLAKWEVMDGAQVAIDDIIAVIETDKITYDLKAQANGILHHRAKPQDICLVGAVIGFIGSPDEAIPEGPGDLQTGPVDVAQPPAEQKPPSPATPVAAQPVSSPKDGFVVATPAARRMARNAGLELSFISGTGPAGRVTEQDVQVYIKTLDGLQVTPVARKLAQDHRIDLTRLTGSGPGGRITKEDVQQATGGQVEVPTRPDEPVPTVAKVVPFAGMRQMIAENMLKSLHNMAQVTLTTEVDVTELVDLREHLKKRIDITYTDLIVKAVTLGLRQHPRLNASLVGNEIHLAEDIHIGFGVALEEGLIVPVITHADRLTLSEIGMRVRDLAARARQNTLNIDEVTGSTFTISNLGAYGIDGFTPIINPPQAAILGVGRIIEKPGIYRGEIARRSMLVLSLTFDHRLVDGSPAAAFLQKLAEILAHPYYLKDG